MNAGFEGDPVAFRGTGSEDGSPPAADEEREEAGSVDRFYQGVVAQVDWGLETGVVRSVSGREIAFDFPFLTVMGSYRRVESLRTGMRVGFDVGWTSRGLRVTTLKVYD